MIRFLDAGESHGRCLTAILEGIPAGLKIDKDLINKNLLLRQSGYGRGARQKIESDKVEFLSGVRFGETIGSPITISIKNRDFENWLDIMSPNAQKTNKKSISVPRPGHADLAGYIKYDREDMRDVLERSSARETAIRVAVGSICENVLAQIGVDIISFVKSIGNISIDSVDYNDKQLTKKIESSSVFCPDEKISDKMIAEIEEAKLKNDSIGGVIEACAMGVMPGLGSYSQWDRKLDARIAYAVMSIQAIKAVEIGNGIKNAYNLGSSVHDEILFQKGYIRKTNNAGGIEGGMSNGENIVVRAYMKPIPTLKKGLNSIDVKTKLPHISHFERSDVCAVPAASIVAKSIIAYELLNAYMEKFGSDTLNELKKRVYEYKIYLKNK